MMRSGKVGVSNVSTRCFVGRMFPSRRIVMRRTPLTFCSLKCSRISSSGVCNNSGSDITPRDLFKEACGVTVTVNDPRLWQLER